MKSTRRTSFLPDLCVQRSYESEKTHSGFNRYFPQFIYNWGKLTRSHSTLPLRIIPPILYSISFISLQIFATTAEMELTRPHKTNGLGVQVEDTQICVVMVGLPARGKSLIAQKGTNLYISKRRVHSQTLN